MRTMTIQTQTPGGQDQPIPVKDAVEAVQAALEVCNASSRGPFTLHKLPSSRSMGAWLAIDSKGGHRVAQIMTPIKSYVGAGSTDWEPEDGPRDADFIVAARAGYAATLEYLLERLTDDIGDIPVAWAEYRAVARIVEWWRARGGGK